MYKRLLFLLLFLPIIISGQNPARSGKEEPLSRILFVFDASQSMYARWQSDMKINIAKKLMVNLLDSLATFQNLEIALRVYGHQKNYPPPDCYDTRLEVPFAPGNISSIKAKILSLTPRGTTPIAYSLQQVVNDFPPCSNCRNIIILITDGIEECGGDPCAASAELQKHGIALKPFIIGIGKDFRDVFNCVGTYFDASSETAFQKALNTVIVQALNSTSMQVNLLDINNRPSESNVNMTFYDRASGKMKYNFIHTLNHRGLPDTLILDPLITYDLVVHTIPPVRLDSITLSPGSHLTASLSAPQGYLDLRMGTNERIVKNLFAIVKEHGDYKTLNVQNFGDTKKYLCGSYDLEILTLPRIYMTDVKIRQGKTTTIDIPLPGIVVIRKSVNGFGSLYIERNNGVEWIYDLRENVLQETLVLQPGNYRVVYRSKNAERSMYSIENTFTIHPGGTSNVNLFSY
ncbi:MAG TPA: VWA domain-containing protein [Lentimicrobium sp.]|nr:VWA domain-containing protein [Lentimicrobium sp.]